MFSWHDLLLLLVFLLRGSFVTAFDTDFGSFLGGLGLVLNALECSFFLNLAETLRRYAGGGFIGFGLC